MIKSYVPRSAILAQLESMTKTGLFLEFCLEEIKETYNLMDSEITGFRDCFLFLHPDHSSPTTPN